MEGSDIKDSLGTEAKIRSQAIVRPSTRSMAVARHWLPSIFSRPTVNDSSGKLRNGAALVLWEYSRISGKCHMFVSCQVSFEIYASNGYNSDNTSSLRDSNFESAEYVIRNVFFFVDNDARNVAK